MITSEALGTCGTLPRHAKTSYACCQGSLIKGYSRVSLAVWHLSSESSYYSGHGEHRRSLCKQVEGLPQRAPHGWREPGLGVNPRPPALDSPETGPGVTTSVAFCCWRCAVGMQCRRIGFR